MNSATVIPHHDFSGKVALVTGGSSGIGYQTALVLAAAGASVGVGFLNNQDGADSACTQIQIGRAHV